MLIQGTNDTTVHPESAKIAYLSLLSKGKDIQLKLIEGANYSFNLLHQPEIDGWQQMIEMTYQWFANQ